MVIYGNNLHEKLFGRAVSRDYLLKSTPFCEIVEDPDFELDVDIAIDFHAALRGNQAAATRVVNNLVLNSGELDWSTINFYVDKMLPHPYFKAHIDRINSIFNDPNYPNFGFLDYVTNDTLTESDNITKTIDNKNLGEEVSTISKNKKYVISYPGDIDFTEFGAPNSIPGTVFISSITGNIGDGTVKEVVSETGNINVGDIIGTGSVNFNDNDANDALSSDGGFLRKLRQKAQDCVNEPCNIFEVVSDSIGRMSQIASTKTGENTFDLGGLAGTCTNVINGLDQTVFNNMPSSFQKGIADVTTVAKQAWTNTQAILTGKNNIDRLTSHIQRTGDARTYLGSRSQPLSFTPDVKTFFNFDQSSGAILADVAKNLGGCYNKFQFSYRYNPYVDNESTPEKPNDRQVNGLPYTTAPAGGWDNAGITPYTMGDCTHQSDGIVNVPYGGGAPGSDSFHSNDLPPQASPVRFAEGDEVDSGEVWLSKPLVMGSKKRGASGYSIFGGYIDRENKKILVDNYTSSSPGGNSDDDLTMSGEVFVSNIRICPSFWVDPGDGVGGTDAALNGSPLSDKNYIINKLSNGYSHILSEESMGKLQNVNNSKVFDDGVALSGPLINALGAREKLKKDAFTWKGRSYNNKAFAVLRKPGECPKIFKIVDYNSQSIHNVDFTPAAYKLMFNADPPSRPIKEHAATLSKYGWTAGIASHGDEGEIEVRIAFGSYEKVKELINQEIQCGDIEIPETSVPVVMTNQGATRNLPIHPDLKQALSVAGGAVQADKIVVYSGGQKAPRRTGSTRHNVATNSRGTGGMAADFYIYKNGKKVPYTDNKVWDTFSKVFVQVTKGMGYKPSGGCGPSYMQGGTAAHFDIAAGYTTSTAAIWINTQSGVSRGNKLRTTPWLSNFGV